MLTAVRENGQLRAQLRMMGFEPPQTSYEFPCDQTTLSPTSRQSISLNQKSPRGGQHQVISPSMAGFERTSKTLDNDDRPSSYKKRRLDQYQGVFIPETNTSQKPIPRSRDLMPPPQVPFDKQARQPLRTASMNESVHLTLPSPDRPKTDLAASEGWKLCQNQQWSSLGTRALGPSHLNAENPPHRSEKAYTMSGAMPPSYAASKSNILSSPPGVKSLNYDGRYSAAIYAREFMSTPAHRTHLDEPFGSEPTRPWMTETTRTPSLLLQDLEPNMPPHLQHYQAYRQPLSLRRPSPSTRVQTDMFFDENPLDHFYGPRRRLDSHSTPLHIEMPTTTRLSNQFKIPTSVSSPFFRRTSDLQSSSSPPGTGLFGYPSMPSRSSPPRRGYSFQPRRSRELK